MNLGDSCLNCILQPRYTTRCISEELKKKKPYFLVISKIINKQIFSINFDREKKCQRKKLLEKGNESVKYKDLKNL